MVNGQSGEIYAHDEDLNLIPIFGNNSVPLWSNITLYLDFLVPQNVTSVVLQVPSDVTSGEISYFDEEDNFVVSVYIIYPIFCFPHLSDSYF